MHKYICILAVDSFCSIWQRGYIHIFDLSKQSQWFMTPQQQHTKRIIILILIPHIHTESNNHLLVILCCPVNKNVRPNIVVGLFIPYNILFWPSFTSSRILSWYSQTLLDVNNAFAPMIINYFSSKWMLNTTNHRISDSVILSIFWFYDDVLMCVYAWRPCISLTCSVVHWVRLTRSSHDSMHTHTSYHSAFF